MLEKRPAQAGKIILLHGASSCGKSTIARALQSSIDQPIWHISIDHLRDSGALPSERIDRGEFKWVDMRAAFFNGFHRSLAAYAQEGNNLIVEHIVDADDWLADLVALLQPLDVFFVGIHCSLAELIRREKERGDRRLGSAEADFHTVHRNRRYDLEVSSEDPVEMNVQRILTAWRKRTPPLVFAQLALAP